MKKSDSILKISPALLKAQVQMEGAVKGSVNPFFKSKYADYSSVLEACKDALNSNGITILQPHSVEVKDGLLICTVETVLLHESGEYISSETQVRTKADNDPQQQGSGITFARRYSLQSLIALPTEDDDSESAMDRNKKGQNKDTKPTVATTKVEDPPVKAESGPEAPPARRRVAVSTEGQTKPVVPVKTEVVKSTVNTTNGQW